MKKKGSSTVRKWCSASEKENRTIPYTAWRLLLLKSNLISLNDEAGVTLNKPVNSKSALVTIKGKKDITRYRLTFNEAGCITSPFQEIVNEYRLNLMAIPTFQFFDEIEYEYVMPELLENFGHAIVMAIGSEYEVVCFKKSAAGEYHRVKREIDEYFEGWLHSPTFRIISGWRSRTSNEANYAPLKVSTYNIWISSYSHHIPWDNSYFKQY